MIFGFSTMGAPGLTLAGASALAESFGLDFVELRALENRLDLPAYMEGRWVEATKPIRLVASSLRLADAGLADVKECVRFAFLAARLGARYVRVYGGGEGVSDGELSLAAATLQKLRRELASNACKVEMLLETHDAFSSSALCARFNGLLEQPVGILWDSHHTWKLAGESPAESWSLLGPWIRHVHYKDSRSSTGAPSGYHYVLPRQGEYPTAELMNLLRKVNYQGGVSLEWEKLWHAELPDLHDALVEFAPITRQSSRDTAQ